MPPGSRNPAAEPPPVPPRGGAHEAADVIYFALGAARGRGVDLVAGAAQLDARAARITRRRGDAKPGGTTT